MYENRTQRLRDALEALQAAVLQLNADMAKIHRLVPEIEVLATAALLDPSTPAPLAEAAPLAAAAEAKPAVPRYLGPGQLAGLLCVSRATLNRMERDGVLPKRVIMGGRRVWFGPAIERWEADAQNRELPRRARRTKAPPG